MTVCVHVTILRCGPLQQSRVPTRLDEDGDEYAYHIPNQVAPLVHQGKGTKYPR